jgi:peptide/nickel transport system permease protein
LVAICIVSLLGPGLVNSVIAVGVSYIPEFARITRGQVTTVVAQPYVAGGYAIGASHPRILRRYVFLNAFPPLLVAATLRLPMAILMTAGLSFIGLGAQPPTAEWGAMIADSRDHLRVAPHVMLGPSTALMLTVVGFNLLGEGLNDALGLRRE